MKKIYKISNYLFLFFISIILFGGLFFNTSEIDRVPTFSLLFGTMIMTILFLLIYHIYNKKVEGTNITKKLEIKYLKIISIIIISILFISSIFLFNDGGHNQDDNYTISSSWDFNILVGYVNTVVDGQSFDTSTKKEYIDYRITYDNIDGAALLLIPIYKVFRLFNINDNLIPGVITNILFIYFSLILSYFIVRKIYGNKKAIFFLSITPFMTPIYLYSSIFYTDTLSMPFVLGSICYFIYNRDNLSFKKLIFLGFLIAIGSMIKMTVLLVAFSIMIDLLVYNKRKLKSNILVFVITIFIIMFSVNTYFYPKFLPKSGKLNRLPSEHFIMMGMNEEKKTFTEGNQNVKLYGAFFHKDVEYSLFYNNKEELKEYQKDKNIKYYSIISKSNSTYKQRKVLIINKLIFRLMNKNIVEHTTFFSRKLIQTWADGSLYVPVKLNRGYKIQNIIGDFVRVSGKNFKIYYYLSHFIHMSFILFIWIGCIGKIQNNYSENIIKLSLLLLIFLLLIWETRSRYILNYVLLLYLLAIRGMDKSVDFLNKHFS